MGDDDATRIAERSLDALRDGRQDDAVILLTALADLCPSPADEPKAF